MAMGTRVHTLMVMGIQATVAMAAMVATAARLLARELLAPTLGMARLPLAVSI